MPLNIDFQQVLLHLFNFVILGGGLYFLLWTRSSCPPSAPPASRSCGARA